ncbi:hypothetical protein BJV82DRAFT_593316 [Fennellomyces sp. T-0311]|nr:hypothetical protein BJV82DRAFT_593316 [Fennellomyces sp. T-0311]
MVSFDGSEALNAYVSDSDDPCFNDFISMNSENISKWSFKYGKTAEELYSMWRQRFVLSLKCKGKLENVKTSKHFDKKMWEPISELAAKLHQTKKSFQLSYLDGLLATAKPMDEILREINADSSSSSQPSQASEQQLPSEQEPVSPPEQQRVVHENFNELELEGKLHFIAYKKFTGKSLTAHESGILDSVSSDGSMKGALLYLAAQQLKLNNMSTLDVAIVKSCLSRVVNFVNPNIRDVILATVDNEVKTRLLTMETRPLAKLEPEVEAYMHEIFLVAERDDTDAVLTMIQERKLTCIKNKERASQMYLVLCCLERVVENFGLWSSDEKESEITFYRRAASILDLVFKDTDILLNDGESGSMTSKSEIETNKVLFMAHDTSAAFARKIDLLFKCKESSTKVELASNEWKRSYVSNNAKISQQSKNLRVNASILNNLKRFGIAETMSMDWIGNSGYLYSLLWLPDEEVYVATCLSDELHMPVKNVLLRDMEETMTAFLALKTLLVENARIIKPAIYRISRKRKMNSIASSTVASSSATSLPSTSSTPSTPSAPSTLSAQPLFIDEANPVFIFFSPRSNRYKKQRLIDESSDEEEELD